MCGYWLVFWRLEYRYTATGLNKGEIVRTDYHQVGPVGRQSAGYASHKILRYRVWPSFNTGTTAAAGGLKTGLTLLAQALSKEREGG